jgi:hypothetical protein
LLQFGSNIKLSADPNQNKILGSTVLIYIILFFPFSFLSFLRVSSLPKCYHNVTSETSDVHGKGNFTLCVVCWHRVELHMMDLETCQRNLLSISGRK